jgi:DNA-binding NtrC family response regulator
VAGISPLAVRALTDRAWPGNVRELREVVERAIVCGASHFIDVADLSPGGGAGADRLPSLAEAEETLVRIAMARFGGNKQAVARALGISRHRLYDRLRLMRGS